MKSWIRRVLVLLAALAAVTVLGASAADASDGAHWGAPALTHTHGIIWD